MSEEQRDAATLGYQWKPAPENDTNMEEMELSGSEPRMGKGQGLCSSRTGTMKEFWGRSIHRRVRQDLKEEKEEQLQGWEANFQGLVKAMESPQSGRGNTPQQKLSPARDTKAFLLPCKSRADTCQQPRGIKAAQASQGLSVESEVTDGGVKSENKPGSKKVKEEILDEEAPSLDAQRQHFRQLCYTEAEGPRKVCQSLQELCRQWLKPKEHTKERILELVVLEQFLVILPPELQNWLQGHKPETCFQAVALAEDFLLKQQEDKRQEEKESVKKIIVNLPEEGATSSFVVIKQESDSDASSQGLCAVIFGSWTNFSC
ncbi:zinc finger protein with KRAB and SCAN domains 1-like [Heteronotia binoei]|uniref:zinc finger protein with KRAB and SCAN domains 1-like n=1 Tax=Heteronotia binoei TaxID=13085 RepID=UPI00292DB811|nr:zinc finger protein with KRAB and SCAN domains 1-like [Heteronotia binoei]